ncbi:hypothetical protein Sste5346_007162 [Sporothrix stenoceras]|uniref:RNA-binding S4 domain-containing protein n=1 Tax=Sporothrix stenoceras TaxID=5173 RepID=A0ABR3YV11_9PEZI
MPKLRRANRFHSLLRVRLRQNWNKYNLYNIQANYQNPFLVSRTFFQQKWTAKAITRGYHGEHIREKKWERMFSRRLRSVTNFNPRYMARFDGSEQASGRGSGRQLNPADEKARSLDLDRFNPENGTNLASDRMTPYMQMTYAPMERRLDIAVFRAMFASSARQARQFVVHGAVTVNGRKMVHPGYILKPGDLFQVDVEHVLMATGHPKSKAASRSKGAAKDEAAEAEEEEAAEAEAEAEGEEVEAAEEGGADGEANKSTTRSTPRKNTNWYNAQKAGLLTRKIKAVIKACEDAKKPHNELGKLMRYAYKTALERERGPSPDKTAMSVYLSDMMEKLKIADETRRPESLRLTSAETRQWDRLMENLKLNDVDPTKPYATPWRPRPFMRAFAFIPRYLEVNQNICAAVYLRHPVCRPGFAEVPTPFAPEISQLAHSWYLRRG